METLPPHRLLFGTASRYSTEPHALKSFASQDITRYHLFRKPLNPDSSLDDGAKATSRLIPSTSRPDLSRRETRNPAARNRRDRALEL